MANKGKKFVKCFLCSKRILEENAEPCGCGCGELVCQECDSAGCEGEE